MKRVAVVVLLALLTIDVSGLAAYCSEAACDESCPTDLSGGQCPPNCHYCSCCSLPHATGAAAIVAVAPNAERARYERPADGPLSPEPADILHVPKLLA